MVLVNFEQNATAQLAADPVTEQWRLRSDESIGRKK
jgi:hypothetical protein